ncbi:hypothetical protein GCM10014715_66240 [Streptomyces spiralis]|uniref:Uncharacterized protein n=1 Tax=Streptomyces spiralis TaxID=66376 RepID=A0A919AEB9_9ACTN|nr:hypothetical protein [Streptomyces spiralis]GHF00806.1 hypothetical protein GCM10014715_66240 [Streptomyces spiralis]
MTTRPAPSGRFSPGSARYGRHALSPQDSMKVTSSGYVLEFPHVLEGLRATAAQCKNPAHLDFVTTAITALEEEGRTPYTS